MNQTASPTASPPLPYTIRRLLPQDAVGVNRCVQQIYGDSYVHPDLYHPDELLRQNQTGELVSVVAVTADEQVVGHYALERPGLRPVAEGGEAMVLPAHRHHALMEQMRILLEQEAQQLDLLGLFGHAVTNHVYTQRTDEHFGEHVCAVSLGWSPRSFHNMPEPLPQRMSEILYFKFIRPPARIVAHLPWAHQEICERIYGQLNVEVEFRPPGSLAPEQGSLVIESRLDLQRGVIHVNQIGRDSAAQIGLAITQLQTAGVEAIFIQLPLAQAAAPRLCEELEQANFFFCGIGPCFSNDGDALRLQWLKDRLDLSLLKIESLFAQELLAYVGAQHHSLN